MPEVIGGALQQARSRRPRSFSKDPYVLNYLRTMLRLERTKTIMGKRRPGKRFFPASSHSVRGACAFHLEREITNAHVAWEV
jgi:hypothetical protein